MTTSAHIAHGILQAVVHMRHHYDACCHTVLDDAGCVIELYTTSDLAGIVVRLKRLMRVDAARCDPAAEVANHVAVGRRRWPPPGVTLSQC